MLDVTQFKIDSIKRHLGLLDMMLERNQRWVTERSRPEISQAHEKMVDLIKQTRNEYIAVLELYANGNR